MLAAEKLEDGNAERLSLDVEERGLHRAERGAEERAGAPVGIAVHRLDEMLDLKRVLAEDEALKLAERRDDRVGLPFERRLADAFDAFVGRELEEDEVRPRRIRHEDFLRDDLHAATSTGETRAALHSARRVSPPGLEPLQRRVLHVLRIHLHQLDAVAVGILDPGLQIAVGAHLLFARDA